MTAVAPVINTANAVRVFTLRAQARAYLFRLGEFDLHDAVDHLQADAEKNGLVAAIGQDAVQAIMSKAFAAARADEIALAEFLADVHPMLATGSTKERIRVVWAAAKRARALSVDGNVLHNAFLSLAIKTNLIDARGFWTGDPVRKSVRRHGAEDIAHVITWGMRGWNQFEKGPLK